MTGISIFVHAIRMVVNNLGPALRIGVVPLLVMAAAGWFFGSGFTPMTESGPAVVPDAGAFGRGLVAMVVSILMSLWIAVAWHRFILLEEYPGAFLPHWNGGAIWSYFKATVIVAILMILLAIPLVIVVGMLSAPALMADSEPGLLFGLVFFLVVGIPLTWVGYRLGPVLAGAAIGQGQALKEAWRATARGSADLLVLAVVSVLAIWLPAMVLGALPPVLAVPFNAVLNWVSVMVGVGIITTIYGHYVQGRALNA